MTEKDLGYGFICRCEGCGVEYAEYVNGCPRCWDDSLSRGENLEKFPNRKVICHPRLPGPRTPPLPNRNWEVS